MKRTIVAAACATALLSGCHIYDDIDLTGDIVTESRDVSGFTAVELRGVADVVVVAGEDYAVQVTSDSAIADKVRTRVTGDTLIIDEERGLHFDDYDIAVYVTVPKATSVRLTGVGDVSVSGIDGGSIEIVLDGTGNITATGSADSATIRLDGVGDIRAASLTATDADVRLDGIGSIAIGATERLEARLSGIGDITYAGDPDLDAKIGGIGSIDQS